MQLDETSIVIRERDYLDILDLALMVIRTHALPLLAALAAGIVPMILLNAWLLADYAEPDYEAGFPARYIFYALVLVTWEMPLAGTPATVYLGEALFNRKPSWPRIFRGLRRSVPQLVFYQVFLRGLPAVVILFFPTELAAMGVLVLLLFWPYLFIWKPYLNEVILLEQNPMWANGRDRMTTSHRSKVLHAGQSGDLMARWLAASTIGLVLLLALWATFAAVRAMLLGELDPNDQMLTVYFQLALWTVVGYSTVVRFLSYLDLRIRREGWEVELAMRAERARLTEQLS